MQLFKRTYVEVTKEIRDIIQNYDWTWNKKLNRYFENLNPMIWEAVQHNPKNFIEQLGIAQKSITYDSSKPLAREWPNKQVAYICMEYGIHESLPIYSGGLGVLAADHLKAASDLNINLTAFGLLYHKGYFTQVIDKDGNQKIHPTNFNPHDVLSVVQQDGHELRFTIYIYDTVVQVKVWLVKVGSVNLYLLDTYFDENPEDIRALTAELYGGNNIHRLKQEMLLGLGSIKLMQTIGFSPDVYHLNEGHAAFAAVQLWDNYMKQGLSKIDALEQVKQHALFTTHTPVPAGHDVFGVADIQAAFAQFFAQSSLRIDDLVSLAVEDLGYGPGFNMTCLGMNCSRKTNGVSQLNADALKKLWAYFLQRNHKEIVGVTNGVHYPTFIAPCIQDVLDRYLNLEEQNDITDPAVWDVSKIPDQELWIAHLNAKHKLLSFLRKKVRGNIGKKIFAPGILAYGLLLDPDVLTIGFARRFATYKRSTLIFKDLVRIKRLINDPYRPVQLIFSGKPHPQDEYGQALMRQIIAYANDESFNGRIAFIPDYDISVAKYLVAGVDVWLNTPRVPREASGTSGMKAAVNGVLNFSTYDGWWPESFNHENGWVIGDADLSLSADEQDAQDVESLYNILEHEIIPAYYSDNKQQWIQKMKHSIQSVGPKFSSVRMVLDYTKLYFE